MFFGRSQYGGESPAGTPDRDAFYDDNGGVADRLVMRYELDSVRAHEVVLAGAGETKYPYAPRSSVPVAMPVAVPAGIQPFPPPSRPSTSLSQPFHQPFHHGVYAFDTQRATHEAWMAQQRAWIAAGVPPPPADFMPFPGITSLGGEFLLVIFGYSHMGNCTDGVFCSQTRPRLNLSTRKTQSQLSTHRHSSRRMAWRAWRRRWRRTT